MPDIASSSELVLAYVAESTAGTTPATPAMTNIRLTGESISGNTETQQSNELSPQSNVKDLIPLGRTVQGGIDFELSHATFDPFLEGGLRGTFSGTAPNITLNGGTTKISHTIEKQVIVGATTNYFRFTGMRVTGITLNIGARQIITGNFAFSGLAESHDTAIITGATYTNANQNAVMRAAGVGTIEIDDVAAGVVFRNITLNIQGNLQPEYVVGQDSVYETVYGQRVVTGTMSTLFQDTTLYDLAIDTTSEVKFEFAMGDGTNTYTIVLPRTKITNPRVTGGGNNTPVTGEFDFQALHDNTAGTEIQIIKATA